MVHLRLMGLWIGKPAIYFCNDAKFVYKVCCEWLASLQFDRSIGTYNIDLD